MAKLMVRDYLNPSSGEWETVQGVFVPDVDIPTWTAAGWRLATTFQPGPSGAIPGRVTYADAVAAKNAAVAARNEVIETIEEFENDGIVPDAGVAARITQSGSATKAALDEHYAPTDYVPSMAPASAKHSGVYIPSATAALKWRQIRTDTIVGNRQSHLLWLGDSIGYGAAGTGATQPKPGKVAAGLLRRSLAKKFGASGGGLCHLDNVRLFGNIADDTRFTKTSNVITHTFGPHTTSCWRINAANYATDYIEFTETCSEFWVYTISGGNQFEVTVDGGSAVTLLNTASTGGAGSDIAPESGYFRDTSNFAHNVFKVPAGSVGEHTIQVRPKSVGNVFLCMIEGRTPTLGTFRVGNVSTNGKALSTFWAYTDESQGLYAGPVWLDTMKADLLLLALGVNDWQSQTALSTTKTRLAAIIDRQRGTGTSTYWSTKNAGDAVLVWNPKPDVANLGGGSYTNPSWDAYRNLYYEVATEKDVCLIDLGEQWGGSFSAANSRGLYADAIHPSNAGYLDYAAKVESALFNVI